MLTAPILRRLANGLQDVIVDLISRDVAIVDRHGAAYVVPEVIFCDGVTGALDLSDGQKFGMEELPEDYR